MDVSFLAPLRASRGLGASPAWMVGGRSSTSREGARIAANDFWEDACVISILRAL